MLISQSSLKRKMTRKIIDISSAKRVSLDPSKNGHWHFLSYPGGAFLYVAFGGNGSAVKTD